MKDRSTGDFESVPYICTLLGCSLWTYYGIIRPDLLVATVNGFGIVVESIYIVIFLVFAPHKIKVLITYPYYCISSLFNLCDLFFIHVCQVRTAILVSVLDVGFLLIAILVTNSLYQGDVRSDMIGLIAAGLNIVMYASPLAAMVR